MTTTKNVAKVILVAPDETVLLLRRSDTDTRRPGDWDFPGGGVEAGESTQVAAQRETFEEAGITLELEDLHMVYCGTEFYAPLNESVNRSLFAGRVTTEQQASVRLSFEHSESEWVPAEQALEKFKHWFYNPGLKYALDHELL